MTVASLSVRISSSDEETGGARAGLLARVGRLDAIVDNASINGVWAPIDDLMPNEWDRIVRVNLRGTYLTLALHFHLTRCDCLQRDKRRPGRDGSAAGTRTRPSFNPINVLCPGAIATEISASTHIRHREDVQVPVVCPEGSVALTKGEPGTALMQLMLSIFC